MFSRTRFQSVAETSCISVSPPVTRRVANQGQPATFSHPDAARPRHAGTRPPRPHAGSTLPPPRHHPRGPLLQRPRQSTAMANKMPPMPSLQPGRKVRLAEVVGGGVPPGGSVAVVGLYVFLWCLGGLLGVWCSVDGCSGVLVLFSYGGGILWRVRSCRGGNGRLPLPPEGSGAAVSLCVFFLNGCF